MQTTRPPPCAASRAGRSLRGERGGSGRLAEGYYQSQDERTRHFAQGDAEYFGVPVLVGASTTNGFEVAQISPIRSRSGQNPSSDLCKALDLPKAGVRLARVPADSGRHVHTNRAQGRKSVCRMCHDMLFGLLGQKWRASGPIRSSNLTGGGVNARKWTNIIRASVPRPQRALPLCDVPPRWGSLPGHRVP